MPAVTLTVGNAEITAILDVDTSTTVGRSSRVSTLLGDERHRVGPRTGS